MTHPNSSDLPRWREVWQVLPDWVSFVRHPYLIPKYDKISWLGGAQLIALLTLDLLVGGVLVFGPVAEYQESMGIVDPDIFEGQSLEFIIFEVIILAPLIEETLFRGWLKGAKRGLLVLACTTVWVAIVFLTAHFGTGGAGQAAILLMTTIIIFIWCIFETVAVWRQRDASDFFVRHFAVIFWASALCFGLIHIFNYEHDSYLELLPMIITQSIGGLVLGYVRLRYGLVYAMLHHGAFNGIILMF